MTFRKECVRTLSINKPVPQTQTELHPASMGFKINALRARETLDDSHN